MERKVPTLFELSVKQLPIKSFESQQIIDDMIKKGSIPSMDTLEVIRYKELAHLPCIGHIPKDSSGIQIPPCYYPGYVIPNNKRKRYQEVDGARLADFDKSTRNVKIRIDDSDNLPFWAEVSLDLGQLKDWLEEEHGIIITIPEPYIEGETL